MLIIAGKVYVAPEARDTYVESHRELIKQARTRRDAWIWQSRPIPLIHGE